MRQHPSRVGSQFGQSRRRQERALCCSEEFGSAGAWQEDFGREEQCCVASQEDGLPRCQPYCRHPALLLQPSQLPHLPCLFFKHYTAHTHSTHALSVSINVGSILVHNYARMQQPYSSSWLASARPSAAPLPPAAAAPSRSLLAALTAAALMAVPAVPAVPSSPKKASITAIA